MKKVLSIFAVAVFTIGLLSCESENNLDETKALYEIDACDGCADPPEKRDNDG